MMDLANSLLVLSASAALLAGGCERALDEAQAPAGEAGHAHGEEGDHDHGPMGGHDREGEDDHDAVPLGTARIGDMDVELAQGHGEIEPGKELHLVVKLPYSDSGATVIRAWLGTEDRFSTVVAKAEYAPSHDDYDVHAVAPDPLPENTMWWVEIEKPDGEKLLGSVKPR